MKRILIANRGEIARRVIATAHRLGLETVAVHSEPDAHALHVREATLAFALGGSTSADSYLRADRLLEAARATGADAVHPGYGFLSEDAGFAQAVQEAGLVWIGPPPAAIRALGSKAAAKALAAAHGVPCLPGYAGDDQSDARFAEEAKRIGYPLMVKAVAGGGGRGMRLVTDASQLQAALASARSEALAGFGNGDLLIERAVQHPRHVEVQVFADAHGHVIHLGERDCSVQRRHQKIIEEAPSPAVDAELRARMGDCAVALARAAGYVGAGTVEFLLEECAFLSAAGPSQGAKAPSGGSATGAAVERGGEAAATGRPEQGTAPLGGSATGAAVERGGFFLMEMNTRLQVEHPVTEALTGLDLVEWQIRVARGEPLPLAQALTGLDLVEWQIRVARGEPLPLAQAQVTLQGHAIEVRLCAEDEGFTPHTGRVRHFRPPVAAAFERAPLRFDHALAVGSEVTPYYDAMLGKLIVHADTRAAAIDRLAGALAELELLGLPTNRAFLIECLQDARFRAGAALISYLATDGDRLRESLLKKELIAQNSYGTTAVFASNSQPLACRFDTPLRLRHRDQVQNALVRTRPEGGVAVTDAEGQTREIAATPQADGAWQIGAGGATQRVVAITLPSTQGGPRWHLQAGAIDWWLDDLSFEPASADGGTQAATELRAPFNGRVIRVAVQPGQALAAGETALVIESMKLEHGLSARGDVTVAEVLVGEGQQVAPGQVLLRFAKEAA